MGFLGELWRLTRFEHAIMLAIAVLIGEAVITGHLPPLTLPIALSLLVPILSEAGSFALNDFLDVESDRINRKTDRPLVKGTISPVFALWFSILCISQSVILSYFINMPAFAIALVFNALAVLYNWKLKDLPLVGNAYIALTMAIPFIFGNFVVSEKLAPLTIVLASLGFVSGLAREILKTVQDVEGDRAARKAMTLPMLIGARNAVLLATMLYGVFVPLSVAPFDFGLKFGVLSGACVVIADIAILWSTYKLISAKGDGAAKALKDARDTSLVALFLGLAGYLAAVL
jgi:geranylgeranylglycerol-phosphate geranylgeranyltransferase